MSEPHRKPSADPYRKASFREQARDIVAKDRHDRRYGRAVDTAGAIARALERAYRQGFEDSQVERPSPPPAPISDDAAIEWALIPPRPRMAFWSICLFSIGRADLHGGSADLVETVTSRGTPGWRLIDSRGGEIRVIGGNTTKPLARLGLIAETADEPRRLLITNRGRSTWQRFLERGGRFPHDLTIMPD